MQIKNKKEENFNQESSSNKQCNIERKIPIDNNRRKKLRRMKATWKKVMRSKDKERDSKTKEGKEINLDTKREVKVIN